MENSEQITATLEDAKKVFMYAALVERLPDEQKLELLSNTFQAMTTGLDKMCVSGQAKQAVGLIGECRSVLPVDASFNSMRDTMRKSEETISKYYFLAL